MSDDCLFCKIVRKEIPAKEVLRDEHVVAFHDLNPQAPVHVLVVPTVHAQHLTEFAAQGNAAAAARLLAAASESGTRLGRDGSRVVMNEGHDGGQTVSHLHAHVLAGRPMTWPPG
jgi:histidine triad (HIT) family protein